uniref:Uncharacterized protein n=1 Tax=Pristionchus pacificus TaxID=54126 RepID=A0A2A6CUA2_PRIPA|eukprot:PDM81814.1 hypothetical protein PRIPAC_33968 [Pristionchus pacificus]
MHLETNKNGATATPSCRLIVSNRFDYSSLPSSLRISIGIRIDQPNSIGPRHLTGQINVLNLDKKEPNASSGRLFTTSC